MISPQGFKVIQRDIEKLVQVYSSITDEDVEALEMSGFFSVVKSGGKYYPQDDDVLASYDNMFEVKPLMAAFKAVEMTDVETLKEQLTLWAEKNPNAALENLDVAVENLRLLLRIARKNYRTLVAKSEAGPEDPLGRIAFASHRRNMPYEPDTAVEEKLTKAIHAHFQGYKLLSPEMAQLLRDLMSQGLYPKMFAEPTAPVVYRGMSITSSKGVGWLKRQAGGRLEGVKGSIDVNLKYEPRRGAASWTTSKKVAEGFFQVGANYHIIMHARVGDNPGQFLSAERGLYSTDFASRFTDEREAIGLGTVQVFRIDWFSGDMI